MPTCSISAGYQLPSCSLGQGGVTTVYIAPWSAHTYTLDANDKVTSIGPSSAATFYTFDCVVETAEYTTNVTTNIQNQSIFYEQEVTVFIPKNGSTSTTLRNQYKSLAASGVLIVVKDRLGNYNLIGKTQAAFLVEGSDSAGKAAGDANGYTLKFQAKEPEPAFVVGAGAFTASY